MERSFHGAIHDLKSPLAYVCFSLSSLEGKESDIHKREALSLTAEKVSFLSKKINRILQSRKNIKQIPFKDKTRIFLYDMVEHIEAEIYSMFPEKKISFYNKFEAELSITGVHGYLETVFRILLENAVKYSGINPEVIIRSWNHSNYITIEIEDNGYGIPDKILKKIFNPYFSTDSENGTGIGLYYAKNIIEAHGGGIIVKTSLGKGSTFVINLPYIND